MELRGDGLGGRCPRHLSTGSMLRPPLPSTGSARARSPASSVLWNAPTPARPSRRVSLPSHGSTAPPLVLDPGGPRVFGPRCLGCSIGGPPDPLARRRAGLPGSWETPRCTCPALRPRRALHAWPALGVSTRPSIFLTTSALARVVCRGSITRPAHSLCTLRRADHSATTQHAVPAGGHPLPGGLGYPLGSVKRFPRRPHPSTSLSPSPGDEQPDHAEVEPYDDGQQGSRPPTVVAGPVGLGNGPGLAQAGADCGGRGGVHPVSDARPRDPISIRDDVSPAAIRRYRAPPLPRRDRPPVRAGSSGPSYRA